MRGSTIAIVLTALTAGCGSSGESNMPQDSAEAGPSINQSASVKPTSATGGAPAPAKIAERVREISNPSNEAMVFLYYNLANLAVPIDRWAEQDTSVRFAQPIDKASARQSARAKIKTGAASMDDVGLVRLTMDANLSDFDPSYNEFTIRALSPSSVVNFEAFGEKVGLTFSNAQKAQRLALAPADVQSVQDRIESPRTAVVDVLLRLTGAEAAPQGGSIAATVVDYELRNQASGTVIMRVKVD